MIDLREGNWEIVPFGRHNAADRYVESLDQRDAEDLLRPHKSEYGFLFELRQLLSPTDPVHRMTDEQVIETIACRLATRELLLRVTERPWAGDPGGEKSEKQSVPQPVYGTSAPSPKIEEPEPSSFDSSHDGAAQAAALQAAAESGIPFCQECEKQNRAA